MPSLLRVGVRSFIRAERSTILIKDRFESPVLTFQDLKPFCLLVACSHSFQSGGGEDRKGTKCLTVFVSYTKTPSN